MKCSKHIFLVRLVQAFCHVHWPYRLSCKFWHTMLFSSLLLCYTSVMVNVSGKIKRKKTRSTSFLWLSFLTAGTPETRQQDQVTHRRLPSTRWASTSEKTQSGQRCLAKWRLPSKKLTLTLLPEKGKTKVRWNQLRLFVGFTTWIKWDAHRSSSTTSSDILESNYCIEDWPSGINTWTYHREDRMPLKFTCIDDCTHTEVCAAGCCITSTPIQP